MTAQAIIGSDVNNIVTNNSNISKKSKSQKQESFSKVMEKNNYDNQTKNVVKQEKTEFHNTTTSVITKKHMHLVNNNSENDKSVKTGFIKEQFIIDVKTTINDIADAYKETLDLNDEELMSIMEELAINIFQLPIRELAKEIVVVANGERDITSLLVNENALLDLQSINQFFDDYIPGERIDMPVEELEYLVNEAIDNLVANKQSIIENPNVQLENIQLNNQSNIVDTSDGMLMNSDIMTNNVEFNNISDISKVQYAETIDLGNGKKINIEILDVRTNMTKEDIAINLNNKDMLSMSDSDSNIIQNNYLSDSKQLLNVDNVVDIQSQNKSDILTTEENLINDNEYDLIQNTIEDVADISNQDSNDSISLDDQDVDIVKDTLKDNKVASEVEHNAKDDLLEHNSNENFDNDNTNETFYDKFISNLEKSFGIEKGSVLKEVSNIKEMQEIVNQIVDKIKIDINKETTTMKLNLNPEHLGKVELEVTSKAGVLTADFVVENETAKEALEKGLPTLLEKFNEQGLKVEAIEVTISDYDFTKHDGERKSSKDYEADEKKKKRHGKISLDDMVIENDEIVKEHKIMSNLGIDYSV